MWLNSIFSEGPKIRSKLKTSFFFKPYYDTQKNQNNKYNKT